MFQTVGGFFTFTGVVLTFLTSLIGFIQVRKRQHKQAARLDEIHILVNSNMALVVERITVLTDVLVANGIPVPDAPVLPVYDPNRP